MNRLEKTVNGPLPGPLFAVTLLHWHPIHVHRKIAASRYILGRKRKHMLGLKSGYANLQIGGLRHAIQENGVTGG
jgi:hypothetical protein